MNMIDGTKHYHIFKTLKLNGHWNNIQHIQVSRSEIDNYTHKAH